MVFGGSTSNIIFRQVIIKNNGFSTLFSFFDVICTIPKQCEFFNADHICYGVADIVCSCSNPKSGNFKESSFQLF